MPKLIQETRGGYYLFNQIRRNYIIESQVSHQGVERIGTSLKVEVAAARLPPRVQPHRNKHVCSRRWGSVSELRKPTCALVISAARMQGVLFVKLTFEIHKSDQLAPKEAYLQVCIVMAAHALHSTSSYSK